MASFGGFDHNAQTLRVLTKLEQRYPQFDGLNLTWETLEGVVKHNGPLIGKGRTLADLPAALREHAREQDLELHTWSGPEAQVAALADDIAYNNHDIDDGWRAGLFSIDDLRALPFVGAVFDDVKEDFPAISDPRWMAESIRRLIGARIADMTQESQRRFAALGPRSAAEVRAADHALVAFSDEMQAHEAALRRFLYERMYRAPHVQSVMERAARVVADLFARFIDRPVDLPASWRARAEREGGPRVICDYIAGMTDAYAIEEHARLFNVDPLI
jgi:dGTPase